MEPPPAAGPQTQVQPHHHHHRAKHTPPHRPLGELATPFCLHHGPCHDNALRGFARTFMWGYGVKGGIAFLLRALFSGYLFRPSKWFKTFASSFGMDTFKFGLFMGSLIGSYKTVLCLMRWIRRKEDKWHSLVRRGYLPNVPYGDTILFMLFCAYVQYAFFYEPELFEPGYYKFVRRFGRHATMDRFLEFWREGRTPEPMKDKTMYFWREIREAL